MVEKYFQLLILIKELCRVGHGDQKLDLLCILNHLLCPDKFDLSFKFSFSINGKVFFLGGCFYV